MERRGQMSRHGALKILHGKGLLQDRYNRRMVN
jgi:hypothetical protein